MELAIPGTYQPGMDLVRIHSVASEIEILKSKQKPRKIFINGSDGQRHQFLLKGDYLQVSLFLLLFQEKKTCDSTSA